MTTTPSPRDAINSIIRTLESLLESSEGFIPSWCDTHDLKQVVMPVMIFPREMFLAMGCYPLVFPPEVIRSMASCDSSMTILVPHGMQVTDRETAGPFPGDLNRLNVEALRAFFRDRLHCSDNYPGMVEVCQDYQKVKALVRNLVYARDSQILTRSDLQVVMQAALMLPPAMVLDPLAKLAEHSVTGCVKVPGPVLFLYNWGWHDAGRIYEAENTGAFFAGDDGPVSIIQFDSSFNCLSPEIFQDLVTSMEQSSLDPWSRSPGERCARLYSELGQKGIEGVVFPLSSEGTISHETDYLSRRLMRMGIDPVFTDMDGQRLLEYIKRYQQGL